MTKPKKKKFKKNSKNVMRKIINSIFVDHEKKMEVMAGAYKMLQGTNTSSRDQIYLPPDNPLLMKQGWMEK